MNMRSKQSELEQLVEHLACSRQIAEKVDIRSAYAPALETISGGPGPGDDCAAIPDGNGGYLLLAAEGIRQAFVQEDPWFAGYCAVMVNISDVCAMGGRPLAIVDILCAPDSNSTGSVWSGMQAAARAYGVPVVGGHTTFTRKPGPLSLAAAILGNADSLLTSFEARPGDDLVMAVDLSGGYRGSRPFWNSSLTASPQRLRTLMALLPEIARRGLCTAAKDISNGGIIGTLIMLLECSRVGAVLKLDEVPRPAEVELEKWLLSFPSYGFLLSVPSAHRKELCRLFHAHQVACAIVGQITDQQRLELKLGGESRVFWSACRAQQMEQVILGRPLTSGKKYA